MGILNPTINDAVALFSKAAAKLDAVIKNSESEAAAAHERVTAETARAEVAEATAERASRIRKKIEELVA